MNLSTGTTMVLTAMTEEKPDPDCDLALHYGWPYNIAEIGGTGWKCDSVQLLVDQFTRTYKRACELAPVPRPMITAEFNTDGDVTVEINGEIAEFTKKEIALVRLYPRF